ncbi:hypothetical protein OUZ56_019160 [Daphnia magna]|uniref:Uncharacterized protein n=1 Tax=Daphnia magna TaxID=35525 RepID=A0ABQ9ZAT8_9CRUS|nr:hypothetical protein OUZ56_019160 [Daphnia magna]
MDVSMEWTYLDKIYPFLKKYCLKITYWKSKPICHFSVFLQKIILISRIIGGWGLPDTRLTAPTYLKNGQTFYSSNNFPDQFKIRFWNRFSPARKPTQVPMGDNLS